MAADNTAVDESLDVITDALLTASRLLMAISARSVGQVDETITIAQFRTLVILSNRGPVNLATLAGLLGVQPSATGRMVDRLVAAGLIDRLPHPTSRRELLAALTPRGRDVVYQVTAHRRAEIAGIVAKIPSVRWCCASSTSWASSSAASTRLWPMFAYASIVGP
jgi:DNA-binding MarR family transcriptional regulator